MNIACCLLTLASGLALVAADMRKNEGGTYGDSAPDKPLMGYGSRGAHPGGCECPAAVAYVCGADGNTYDNACMAMCAGVTPVFSGICYQGCMCLEEELPLCLVPDNASFLNPCIFGCQISGDDPRAPFVNLGACSDISECFDCPMDIDYVCDGNDENEYANACFAECVGVTDWRPGVCPGNGNCEQGCADYDAGGYDADVPVCGRDGVNYMDGCLAHCASVIAYPGDCETDCGACGDRGGPEVCGEDGVTYMNACEARCVPVAVAFERPCRASCACMAEELQPVCGTNGNTYMNRCFAECGAVVVESEGACGGYEFAVAPSGVAVAVQSDYYYSYYGDYDEAGAPGEAPVEVLDNY